MRTSIVSSSAVVAGLVSHIPIGLASPTCTRMATQWAVVFNADCTDWYENGESGRRGAIHAPCSKKFSGDVGVHAFPWNDQVAIVDSQNPSSDFSIIQPEQRVAHHGAGVVVVQSTWDIAQGWVWHARQASNVDSINASVEYVTTEAEAEKFVHFEVEVDYRPPPLENRRHRSLDEEEIPTAYDFSDETDGTEASLGYDASWPSWINGLQGNDVPSIGEDEQNEGTYYPIYVHSYEQDLYDFSYSMELSYLESYSLGQEDDDVMPVNMAQSITSADVYVCIDEENTLAEMPFYCDPDRMGTEACYENAAGANEKALRIHGFEMYCAPECLDGHAGGLWCDIFGLDGCRMCDQDCTPVCNGEKSCSSCVSCPPGDYQQYHNTLSPTPSPTAFGTESVLPTTEPTASSTIMDTPSPTSTFTETPVSVPPPTPEPTASGTVMDTPSPTSTLTEAPVYVPPPTLEPAASSTVMDTPSPTMITEMPAQTPPHTPKPTASSTVMDTPSPTMITEMPAQTPPPTPGSTGFETAPSPYPIPEFEGEDSTAAPTSTSVGTAAPTSTSTAAPTTTVYEDLALGGCTAGYAETCYNELPPPEKDVLANSGRGLTCEESCLLNGGPWCKAYGMDGCRFCYTSCASYCEAQGLPADCLCFEC